MKNPKVLKKKLNAAYELHAMVTTLIVVMTCKLTINSSYTGSTPADRSQLGCRCRAISITYAKWAQVGANILLAFQRLTSEPPMKCSEPPFPLSLHIFVYIFLSLPLSLVKRIDSSN